MANFWNKEVCEDVRTEDPCPRGAQVIYPVDSVAAWVWACAEGRLGPSAHSPSSCPAAGGHTEQEPEPCPVQALTGAHRQTGPPVTRSDSHTTQKPSALTVLGRVQAPGPLCVSAEEAEAAGASAELTTASLLSLTLWAACQCATRRAAIRPTSAPNTAEPRDALRRRATPPLRRRCPDDLHNPSCSSTQPDTSCI
uniref:Uncharacterized protein n=1 Tax=Knipowitschia caucasica TaxID=637954 RepID=A0AAV2JJZ6_KNICA